MKIEAVIFDLDGTLIDSMGVWSDVDREFLEKRNIDFPKDLFLDLDGGNSFEEVALYFKNKFCLPETIAEIMQEWTDMVADHYSHSVPLKKGVVELLNLLQKYKIKMGIGTSNSQYLAETALKANGVLEKFPVLVIGQNEVRGKPFPDIFLKVAELLRVKPENCLVIEDVLAGVRAAKNAGMQVFAIYDEHNKKERDLIKEEADLYAEDFSEIVKYIELHLLH